MFENKQQVHLGKFRKNDVFSLGVAENIAVITIMKNNYGRIKLSRDNIDYVINYIVRGYSNFDPNKGTKLITYLVSNARFAVKKLSKKNLYWNGGILSRKKRKTNLLSLDKSIGDSDKKSFYMRDLLKGKFLSPEDNLFVKEIFAFIKNSKFFNDRQKRVLIGHFEENLSLHELSIELNVHHSYISLLFKDGIEKLRYKFHEK